MNQLTEVGSTRYYPLVDGQGSVMKTTDGAGNVVNTYTYDAYGKTRAQTGTQPNTTRSRNLPRRGR